jgi:hypothetical protein
MMYGVCQKGIKRCIPSPFTTPIFTPFKRSQITALCPGGTEQKFEKLFILIFLKNRLKQIKKQSEVIDFTSERCKNVRVEYQYTQIY